MSTALRHHRASSSSQLGSVRERILSRSYQSSQALGPGGVGGVDTYGHPWFVGGVAQSNAKWNLNLTSEHTKTMKPKPVFFSPRFFFSGGWAKQKPREPSFHPFPFSRSGVCFRVEAPQSKRIQKSQSPSTAPGEFQELLFAYYLNSPRPGAVDSAPSLQHPVSTRFRSGTHNIQCLSVNLP